MTDANGNEIFYEYDSLGNRSAVRYPNGTILTYTYDACQRLKEECLTDASGKQLAKYNYTLGKAGERTKITETNEDGTITEISYKYDKLNRLVKEEIECDGSKLINEFTYDAVSNRTSKETTVKGDVSKIADVAETVSDGSNLDDTTETTSGSNDYEIQVTEGKTEYAYNNLNQLISETTEDRAITYEYDANGNLIKQTGDKTITYTYDRLNHLLQATVQKGNAVTTETYEYDYAGNRISKQVNEGEKTYYVIDESSGLAQVVAEVEIIKDASNKETKNLIATYTLNGTERISVERDGNTSHYVYDGHGNVRVLTNQDGEITDNYSYDAYGNLLQAEGETKNDFLYTGEQYNASTGLYYLRARYMNPSTGTFISMDSYQGNVYDPITLHKYLYVGANPVMYVDPTGYDRNLVSTGVSMNVMGVLNGMMTSFVNVGMSLLYQLRALTVAESVSAISVGVIAGVAIDGVMNGDESLVGRVTSMILENALPLICYITVTSEMLAIQTMVKEEAEEFKKDKKYPDNSVYLLLDSQDSYKVKYVGITNNPAKRKAQHERDDIKKNWDMYIFVSGKTRREARVIEQSLICIFTINALANARYEIAVKNIPGFKNELRTAASLLKIPYQNLENLVNRKEWNG